MIMLSNLTRCHSGSRRIIGGPAAAVRRNQWTTTSTTTTTTTTRDDPDRRLLSTAMSDEQAQPESELGMDGAISAKEQHSPLLEHKHSSRQPQRQQQQQSRRRIIPHKSSRGLGRLVATAIGDRTTQLTTVAHQAPVRLIPLMSSPTHYESSRQTPADSRRRQPAICYLGNYGGGLLPGDEHDFDIHVEPGASLILLTQGANRLYKQPTTTTTTTSTANQNQGSAETTTTEEDPNANPNQNHHKPLNPSHTQMTCTVHPGATLIHTPDPNTPFTHSAHRQDTHINILTNDSRAKESEDHNSTCLIWCDWISSGRFANGELATSHLQTTTTIAVNGRTVLRDDLWLGNNQNHNPYNNNSNNNNSTMDSMYWHHTGWQCNAYATLYLYQTNHGSDNNKAMQQMIRRCQTVQYDLSCAPYTRVRQRDDNDTVWDDDHDHDSKSEKNDDVTQLAASLSGARILASVSTVPVPRQQHQHHEQQQLDDDNITVVRLAGMSNEDLYRVLHYCLQPATSQWMNHGGNNSDFNHSTYSTSNNGSWQLYKDRIKAVHSAPIPSLTARPNNQHGILPSDGTSAATTTTGLWQLMLLADSALPTGSFAHSSGLEAAAQLGLFNHEAEPSLETDDGNVASPVPLSDNTSVLQTYVNASVESFLRQAAPILVRVHRAVKHEMQQELSSSTTQQELLFQRLQQLNHRYHLAVVSNDTACEASLIQGKGLLRVALQWTADLAKQQPEGEHYHRAHATLQTLEQQLSSNSNKNEIHLVTALGAVAAVLQVSNHQQPEADDVLTLLGFGVARDIVPAAVRLNLVGPLSSVAILSQAQRAAAGVGAEMMMKDGDQDGSSEDDDDLEQLFLPSSAPVLDAIQPCHDVLAVRLFRS